MAMRILFLALELLFVALLFAFFVSQVLLPLVFGTKMLPAFRTRETEIKDDIIEDRQHDRERSLGEWLPPEARPIPEQEPASPTQADDAPTPKP